ncbi:sugar ABC transporter substrate-binding protein [Gracilibacillus sp. S3-1-1]|uniref:Sugar ABC transporter substrate-binding protein n=1 Tax=Gracilibacillus pellucidus TaxID=3095368 RepID=A0ACC6M2Y5_9BACI|nr:sugar ABC transporter substrate-binding protein [Gracilibacillus sp. S3-1-1]MDX8045311.1 sugar ABC transporter substrate-binding protein [Gracilibacillus sp. S3-1-1]
MKCFRLILVVVFLLLIMVACSGNEENTDGNSQNADGSTKVTFSYWGGDFDKARMEAIKEEFDKVQPDIEVELVNLPDGEEYSQKQTVMMAANTPYDVIQFAEESYQFASRGVLEDLTPYIEEDGVDLSQFYDVAIDAYTHDDKVYGLPLRVGSVIMLYNKDLFDEHNLDYPNEDWTWDDVMSAGEVIADSDEGIFGMNPIGGWWASTAQVLHSFGGGVLNEEKNVFNLDSPESMEAIEFMKEATWDKNISPSSTQIPEGIDLWTSGKIAMLIDGPWHILSSQANITDFDWNITTAPSGSQHATPIFSNAFHMAKDSKVKDEAWEVIKFWTGEEAQEILAQEHGDTPTNKEIAQSDLYLNLDGEAPENFEMMLTSLDGAFPPQVTSEWGEINRAVDEGMSKMIDLDEPIDKVMPGVKSEIESLLDKMND